MATENIIMAIVKRGEEGSHHEKIRVSTLCVSLVAI